VAGAVILLCSSFFVLSFLFLHSFLIVTFDWLLSLCCCGATVSSLADTGLGHKPFFRPGIYGTYSKFPLNIQAFWVYLLVFFYRELNKLESLHVGLVR